MRRRVPWARTIAALLLGLGLVSAAPAALAAGAPPLVTARAGAAPGTIDIQVTGFAPGERLSVWLTGPSQEVMASRRRLADATGAATFRLRLPRHLQPGRWAITVHGLTSDREAIGDVEAPWRGPDVPVVALPERGPAYATAFTFVGSGFAPGERVSYWLSDVGGTTVIPGGTARAALDGSIRFTFPSNADGMSGRWLASVYGQASDHLGIAAFLIDR